MADEPKTPEEEKKEKEIKLNQSQKKSYDDLAESYRKAEEALKRLYKTEDERDAKAEQMLTAIQAKLSSADDLNDLLGRVQSNLDTIKAELEAGTAEDEKASEKRMKFLKVQKEMIIETIKSLEDDTTGKAATKFFDDTLEALDEFASLFDTAGGAIIAQLAKQKMALKAIGVDMPNMYAEMRRVVTDLDDARRELIPFSISIQDASNLQEALAKKTHGSGISLTEMGKAAQSSAASFKMFNEGTAEARAEVSFFEAQLEKMGVKGGAGIIQSIMTDSAAESADVAILKLKKMHLAMAELGAQPKQLYEDYQKLIGTFAMFGESAASNIAKVSFVAQKLEVDVGDITAFGDNFKDYSGAAKTAQTINAVFGRNIIDNPAELVRIFYTGGPGAALIHVREKLFNSGIDLEAMLSGPAGAARLGMLSSLFGVNNQTMGRLLRDRSINQATLDNFAETGELASPEDFDTIVGGTITQTERIKAGAEQLAVQFVTMLVGDGNVFGKLGAAIDSLTKETLDTFEAGSEEYLKPIVDKVKGIFEEAFKPTAAPITAAAPPSADTIAAVAGLEAAKKTDEAAGKLEGAAIALNEMVATMKNTASTTGPGQQSGGPMQIQGTLKIEGLHSGVLTAITRENSGIPQPRNV